MLSNLNLQNKKAFLIDCDGTLADTMQAHYKAYQLAFQLLGLKFDKSDFWKYSPYGGKVLMDNIVPDGVCKDEIIELVAKTKQDLLPVCLDRFMIPNEKLIEFIRKNTDDYYFIVVSNGRRQSISKILEKLGIRYYLSGLFCKEDYEKAKPHPDPYLKAMAKFGLKPEECIVFEDNIIGANAAQQAGIDDKDIVMVNPNEF